MNEGKMGGMPPTQPDKSKIEGKPASAEFPPLTKEDLEEIYDLFLSLFRKFGRMAETTSFFKEHTGTSEPLGGGSKETWFFNSKVTLWQFLYALAMTRHPLVKEISANEFDVTKFNEEILARNKVMAGMKILDLGSGPQPTFSRYCRAFGADVWTVDRSPKYRDVNQVYNQEFLPKEDSDLEDSRHITIDLNDKNAVDVIREKSGGEFNLTTESQLVAAGFFDGGKVGLELLKKGGVHWSSSIQPVLKE